MKPFTIQITREQNELETGDYRDFEQGLHDWCKINCKGKVNERGYTFPMRGLDTWSFFFTFELERDAVLFKTFWDFR